MAWTSFFAARRCWKKVVTRCINCAGKRRVTYLGAGVKSWRGCCFARRRSAILIQIDRRPERTRILRIKGAQRRLDSVAEASYALFDSWTQQCDNGAATNRQPRTTCRRRTPRMRCAIAFHLLHRRQRLIGSVLPVQNCSAVSHLTLETCDPAGLDVPFFDKHAFRQPISGAFFTKRTRLRRPWATILSIFRVRAKHKIRSLRGSNPQPPP